MLFGRASPPNLAITMRIDAIFERLKERLLGTAAVYYATSGDILNTEPDYPTVILLPADEDALPDSTVGGAVTQSFTSTIPVKIYVNEKTPGVLEDVRNLIKNALIGFDINDPQRYTPVNFVEGRLITLNGNMIEWTDMYSARITLSFDRSS